MLKLKAKNSRTTIMKFDAPNEDKDLSRLFFESKTFE
jgi:hypothetical protein